MSVLSHEPAPSTGLPPAATPLLDAMALPRVNLLPPELALIARARRVKAGLGAGLLTVLGAVVVLHTAATADVRAAAGELRTATGTGTALQAEVQGYADVAAVHDQAAQAQQVLTEAMGQEVRYSELLHDLSRTMPADVWLESATFTQAGPSVEAAGGTAGLGTVTFSGTALEHDDVATWLEVLAEQQGFTDAAFSAATTIELGDRGAVTFASTAALTDAALSQRYAARDEG